MSWNTNLLFALMPTAEASFRKSNVYSGYANIYSPGNNIFATMNDMTVDYGFIYNNGDAYYIADSFDDKIETNYNLSLSNTSNFTIVCWIKYDGNANYDRMTGIGDDGDNYCYFRIDNYGNIDFRFRVGGTLNSNYGDTVLSADVWSMATVVKNGTDIKLYINNTECGYGTHAGYTLGDKTFTNPICLLDDGIGSNGFSSPVSYIGYYSDAKDSSWISDMYSLGHNVDGVMCSDNGNGSMSLFSGSRRRVVVCS